MSAKRSVVKYSLTTDHIANVSKMVYLKCMSKKTKTKQPLSTNSLLITVIVGIILVVGMFFGIEFKQDQVQEAVVETLEVVDDVIMEEEEATSEDDSVVE